MWGGITFWQSGRWGHSPPFSLPCPHMIFSLHGCAWSFTCTTWSCDALATSVPSTATTRSPARSPARSAGDPGTTDDNTQGACPDRVRPNPDCARASSTVWMRGGPGGRRQGGGGGGPAVEDMAKSRVAQMEDHENPSVVSHVSPSFFLYTLHGLVFLQSHKSSERPPKEAKEGRGQPQTLQHQNHFPFFSFIS